MKVQEIQWCECFASNIEEHGGDNFYQKIEQIPGD